MIIIKSQDGKITEYDAIIPQLKDKTIKAARKTVNALDTLGTYDSEERAQEVMDMIEEHIRIENTNNRLTLMSSFTANSTRQTIDVFKQNTIFTMPKE